MLARVRAFLVTGVVALAASAMLVATPARASNEPTVVLVHSAWEQASSWSPVAERLRARGYPVLAPDIPLRTLAGDGAVVADVLRHVAGPVVLVGHSYGGMVISNAAAGAANVTALVYVAGYAPEPGESTFALDARVPEPLIAASLLPVPSLAGGLGLDLYVDPLLYRSVLAQDVPEPTTAAMAATQRPLTLAALTEPSRAAAWKTIPSWYMVAHDDRSLAPATERFMAARANATTVEIASSHAAQLSHPDAVTDLIVAATQPRPPAAVIANLRVSPRMFRSARSAARVSYVLNSPASVRFTARRAVAGRSVGGHCVAPTVSRRRDRLCVRFEPVPGTFTRSRPAGPDRFTFKARFAGRTLAPSRYRLVATPTADGQTGKPAVAPFRIVP